MTQGLLHLDFKTGATSQDLKSAKRWLLKTGVATPLTDMTVAAL